MPLPLQPDVISISSTVPDDVEDELELLGVIELLLELLDDELLDEIEEELELLELVTAAELVVAGGVSLEPPPPPPPQADRSKLRVTNEIRLMLHMVSPLFLCLRVVLVNYTISLRGLYTG